MFDARARLGSHLDKMQQTLARRGYSISFHIFSCSFALTPQLSNPAHRLSIDGIVIGKGENMANPNKPDQPKGVQSTGNQPQSGGHESYSFRCADAGYKECLWETKGSTPDEVLQKAEQHGREQHRITNMDDETRNKVRSKIQRAA
jgi:predicted small metal-binding protein